MWSVSISFEFHLESILETTSVLPILFVAAILFITWRYRRCFKSLVNESCGIFGRFQERKPVPEENGENQFNKVWEIFENEAFCFSLEAVCAIFASKINKSTITRTEALTYIDLPFFLIFGRFFKHNGVWEHVDFWQSFLVNNTLHKDKWTVLKCLVEIEDADQENVISG